VQVGVIKIPKLVSCGRAPQLAFQATWGKQVKKDPSANWIKLKKTLLEGLPTAGGGVDGGSQLQPAKEINAWGAGQGPVTARRRKHALAEACGLLCVQVGFHAKILGRGGRREALHKKESKCVETTPRSQSNPSTDQNKKHSKAEMPSPEVVPGKKKKRPQ